jgi:hypothetical protein
MTNHAFETDWISHQPDQGHNAGGCHPVPLRDPYVLWDTREFEPTTYEIKIGSTYPGPLSVPTRMLNSTTSRYDTYWGPLYNLGTAGAAHDLHVYYDWPRGVNETAGDLIAIKYYSSFLTNESLGVSWPLSWNDYEGDPCEAPFTVIYGLGHIGRNEDWSMYCTQELYPGPRFLDTGSFSLDFIDGITGQNIYRSFAGHYLNAFDEGLDFFPGEVDFFGNYAELNNEIVTITHDPRCRETYVWVGTELVIVANAGDDTDQSIDRYHYSDEDCQNWDWTSDAVTDSLYMELNRFNPAAYQRDGSDYVKGTAWSGVVGVAKFRGSPSYEDLVYWQEYFKVPYEAAPHTYGFIDPLPLTDVEEIYPNPFRYQYTGAIQTYTVPPCVDNIRITCYGAGRGNDGLGGAGGMAEADFAVTPGQVFDVYVGGSPSGIAGGWPNGGQSDNGASNEGQGGRGSSHVIPQGGAFTAALVVGGGGGGVNDLGGSRNTVAEGVTAGSGGYPNGSDGNGVSGPDNGIEWGGKGGTQTAGGIGGQSGSTNGEAGDTDGQGTGGDAVGSGNFFHFGGGSGGGGWHGGGGAGAPRLYGGGSYAGDGGGGSSYTAPSGSNPNYVNASWYGHGMVEILALVPAEEIGC